jgi:hypothetical protein
MSGLSGYDQWKTTNPDEDFEGNILFIDVEEGQLTFNGDEGFLRETVEIDNEPDSVDEDDERIVRELAVIRRRYEVVEFDLSSSVDFPQEYGVTRPINLRSLIERSFEAGA